MSNNIDNNRTMVSQIEPAIVIEGNELSIRAQNWPAYCPVTIRLDDKTIKPARIALGTRNGNEILPDAMGNFVCMISTVDLKHGKHVITLTTHYQDSNKFEGTFEVVERPHPSGERDSEFASNENEESESWYLRELDFYNRRFKTIGFIPDNIRSFQLEQVKTLRQIEKAKLTDRGNNTFHGPITGGCNWNPTGSGPIVVHKRWPGGFRAFAGRTLAITISKSSPNVMFIGTANGGIWKSEDFGFRWSPKSDYNDSLAIGTIVIDPNNPSRIFAGTGEFHGAGNGGLTYYGSGILRSTDEGETWENLITSPTFQGDEISKLLFDKLDTNSQHMFLSSATGVYESTDGGLNWNLLLAGSVSDLVVVTVTIGPPTKIKLIAGLNGSGLWTSTKTGSSWSSWVKITGSGIPSLASGRIALGQSENKPQTIYALFTGSGIEGIAKTTDGGSTWNEVTVRFNKKVTTRSNAILGHSHVVTIPASDMTSNPSSHSYTTDSSGSPPHTHTISFTDIDIKTVAGGKNVFKATDPDATGHSHTFGFIVVNQLSYNLHISVHPDNTNIIFLGEITEWKNNTGGGVFDKLAELHADQHCFAFDPVFPDSVWLGSDGGVFSSNDSGISWEHRNVNLDTLQYMSISLHPQWETIMIGGTQDNGTHRYSGSPAWEFVDTGDGGFSEIDFNLPTRMYHGFTNNAIFRSDDAGITWQSKTGSITGSSEFYPPFTLDPSNSNICYFGNAKLWRSDNNADTWSAITDTLIGNITAIAVHPFDSNVIYVSTNVAHVYRVQRIGPTWGIGDVATTDITAPPIPSGVYTSDLAVDTAGNVWLTVSSVTFTESTGEFTNDHVFMLSPSGTWLNRSNNLPKANPINTIVIDRTNPNRLFCGGDVGVYRTENAGLFWFIWDEGLPNVPVFDLEIHGPTRIIRAATHGRSVWERQITDVPACRIVDLYIRDNIIDSGRRQPSPESSVHPFDPTVGTYHWQSEDIKVDSPDPDFEEIFHYADFEGKLVHEKIIPGKVNKIYAQVHNRGINKVTGTKVRLFYARVAAVLPHLPSDFWSAGKPFDTNPSGTDWLPVGPVMYLGDLEPAKPKLGAWDWFVPPDLPEHTCLLALTTCKEDPLIGTGMFDVDTLVRQNKRVALKNIHPLHSGLDGLSPKEAMILDFNHKAGSSSICDLGIEWGSLPPDAILLIAFEKLSDKKIILAKPEDLTKAGISMAKNKEKYFKEKINYKCGQIKYLDLNHVYQITRTNVNFSKIPSISIPEDKNVVTIAINLIFSKPPQSETQFNIFQIIGKQISGGVTYIFKPNSIQ